MKTMQFEDQVEILAKWFKDWDDCEQTVALYSLLKRVKKCQAKFLCQCLHHFLSDCSELANIEAEANNSDYVSHLMSVGNKADVIRILLSHLPLLHPGNDATKNSYLRVLPSVLGYAIERSEFLEESRQLLSYSLIHPAFDNKERHMLTQWMSGLDGSLHSSNNKHVDSPGEVSPDSMSATNSLETGVSLSDWSQSDDLLTNKKQGNSGPPPPIDKPACPLPLIATTPEHQVADGMSDVKSWLKSLRLHKYADIFTTMTYDEMMNMNADDLDEKLVLAKPTSLSRHSVLVSRIRARRVMGNILEGDDFFFDSVVPVVGIELRNVTKGARNKIMISIRKLHERFTLLQQLENEILGGGSLRSALQELKTIIQTPIKQFNSSRLPYPPGDVGSPGRREVIEEGDIPSLFTKVMGKACTQLLVSKPDEENITLYMKLLERCIQHKAFTDLHKRRLMSWKQQVNKMYRSLSRNSRPPQSRSQPNVGGFSNFRRAPRSHFNPQLRAPTSRPLNPLSPPIRAVGMFPQNQMSWYGSSMNPLAQTSTIDTVRKTASLDPRLGQRYQEHDDEMQNTDIDNLVSLCHSVAECALSDSHDGTSTL